MDTPVSSLESLFERIEAYGKTTLELTKLRALDTIIFVVTTLISRLGVAAMVSMFFLVLNVGIALYLGEQLGKNYYGFFIVAAFYALAGLLMHSFLFDWIKKPVHDLIIQKSLQSPGHAQ